MSIRYTVVARDPDMPLCEYQFDASLPAKAKNSMKSYLEQGIIMERNASTMSDYEQYIACTLNQTILFGCIWDASMNEDKAFRFLKDIRTEFSSKIYKGYLEKVHEQHNLKPLCFDKYFKNSFIKVQDNYNTGISQK